MDPQPCPLCKGTPAVTTYCLRTGIESVVRCCGLVSLPHPEERVAVGLWDDWVEMRRRHEKREVK